MFQFLWSSPAVPAPSPLRVSLSVLAEIKNSVGTLPPERGGMLGGRPEDGVVTHFHFDKTATSESLIYSPDVDVLNPLLKDDWNPKGIRLLGFAHSHPGLREPSRGDLEYSQRILEANPELDRLLIPIVISAADSGRFEFQPFAVVRGDDGVEVSRLDLEVVDESGQPLNDWETALVEKSVVLNADTAPDAVAGVPHDVAKPTYDATDRTIGVDRPTTDGDVEGETFRRVVRAYDLDRLRTSRLIYVGAGGAASFIEEAARTGVGQHVLIDPDVVAETNLATQQTYRRDIGRPKVEAIADRIRDINPNALVVPLHRSLDDIDDGEFEFLASGRSGRWPVSQTLLCGFTDNFFPQARVNRLALQFGLPSLCAQVYQEGRGAELTFTHPLLTRACHRCILDPRFRAYLEEGYRNDVTSDSAPIFSTTRLNALKGFIALSLLHYGSEHPRWGRMLERIGTRNLVQVRMDPDVATTLGLGVFDRVLGTADSDRIFFDESLWLSQEAEDGRAGRRRCPDCGGTGRLLDSAGTFSDTRIMRT